ncbi:hypothetical protein D3C76_1765180 [compost metagenome]
MELAPRQDQRGRGADDDEHGQEQNHQAAQVQHAAKKLGAGHQSDIFPAVRVRLDGNDGMRDSPQIDAVDTC